MNATPRQPAVLSFLWPLMTIIVIFLLEMIAVLRINDRLFLFLFDDAYIYFEQARNMLSGTYGHNPGEISVPCSTILWPFILTPLTALPFFEWAVLLLNLGTVIAVVRVQYLIIAPIFPRLPEGRQPGRTQVAVYILLVSMIFIPNLMVLLFSGMETPLHVLAVSLVLLGLIREQQTGRTPHYLMLGLVVSPLVRYESLGIVCPALIYLYLRGHRSNTLLAGLLVALTLFSFSLYLYIHDIGILPTSIMAKNIHQNGHAGFVDNIVTNFMINLKNPFSLLLIICTGGLLPAVIAGRYRRARGLAAIMVTGGLLHLIVGHILHLPLFRYEAYLINASALTIAYIYLPDILRYCQRRWWAVVLTLIPFVLLSLPSLITTALIPAISNVIYRHHYQMHRLATEFYPYPAAVNDLGWVTYKNSAFVLDLWGVGSHEALRCGLQKNSLACVARLAERRGVRLVMITNSWFQNVPDGWIRIGDYHPGTNHFLIDPFVRGIANHVDFYVTDKRYLEEAVRAIKKFGGSLPPTAQFKFSPYIAYFFNTGPTPPSFE